MSGTLSKTWWLLALCGILDATHASINLLMMKLPLTYRIFGSNSNAVRDMGLLALAAGACAIAAGLWSVGKYHSGLLSLHGLALGAFGLIVVSPLVTRSTELSSDLAVIHGDGREHRGVCFGNRSNAAAR